MRGPRRLFAVIAILIGLNGCGSHLGEYKVEDVTVVHRYPEDGSEYDDVAAIASHYHEFVRVEISSVFNLFDADTGAGLYTNADFCPMRNDHRIIAFEPRASDEKAVESWKRTEKYAPNGNDGRYHYFVFLVSRSPARKIFSNDSGLIEEYDLRSANAPICLKFSVPGYNLTPSQSSVIQVSRELLGKAFAIGELGRGKTENSPRN